MLIMFEDINAKLENFIRELEMIFLKIHCKSEEKPNIYPKTEK